MSQSLNHLCSPLLCLSQCVHISLVLGTPNLYPSLQMHLTSAEHRERITSLDLLAKLLLMQLRVQPASFDARVHYWLMFDLVFTTAPSFFSAKLLFS